MKVILVIGCLIAAVCAVPSPIEEWNSFKVRHGKDYKSSEEENFRLGVYLSNKKMIEEHNKRFAAGLETYDLKINHFGDKLADEITAMFNGFNRTGVRALKKHASLRHEVQENVELPAKLDWREKGAVTPVKNQGSCGSCWAFSATGSIESATFLKTGKLVPLSEQNLMDCAGYKYGNEGCSGGLMTNAFDYVIDNGINSEETYPYEEMDDTCKFKKNKIAARISDYSNLPEADESALQKAVATVGPISVAINAGLTKFSFYNSGVFYDRRCDASLDHGVLLVGYGTENGQDYWLVKNSWGADWGIDGYIKMARNRNNQCGIASMASYPIV